MPLPNAIEHSRVGGRELDRADVVAEVEVGVQPPSEALVEALCPIDVGDGQRHDLELHVDRAPVRRSPSRRQLPTSVVLMPTSNWGLGIATTLAPRPIRRAREVPGRGTGPGDRPGSHGRDGALRARTWAHGNHRGYQFLAFPAEEPPSIECNEDAGQELIDN